MKKITLSLLLAFFLGATTQAAPDKEFDCLVKNVYYESRGESRKGQLAVALVTLNRVDSDRYPSTICGVVYQKRQFSWTHKFKKSKINQKAWQKAKDVAFEAFMNRDVLGSFYATHFHTKAVRPGWKLRRVAVIGQHIFYA